MDFDVLSVFCGAGGLDLGFQKAGFRTVLAIDNNDAAVRSFNLNHEVDLAVRKDLSRVSASDILGLLPKYCRPVGMIGGPPCQGFSRGNVFADDADPRNKLPYRYAAILKAMNERFALHFFVFENVVGLLTAKFSSRFEKVKQKLDDAGFDLHTAVLNASDFAVPQRRRRLFIVGLNKQMYAGVKFAFPKGQETKRTLRDVLAGLPAPTFWSKGLDPSSIPYHPNHWTMVPKSPKFKSDTSSDGRSFRKLDWDEVSPTAAYGNRELHVHPEGGRRISILEAMLIQGFPQKYQLAGNLSEQVTQVSNAVPPPVARSIASAIRGIMSRTDETAGHRAAESQHGN